MPQVMVFERDYTDNDETVFRLASSLSPDWIEVTDEELQLLIRYTTYKVLVKKTEPDLADILAQARAAKDRAEAAQAKQRAAEEKRRAEAKKKAEERANKRQAKTIEELKKQAEQLGLVVAPHPLLK